MINGNTGQSYDCHGCISAGHAPGQIPDACIGCIRRYPGENTRLPDNYILDMCAHGAKTDTNFPALQQWVIVKDPTTDMPKKESFDKHKGFYVVVTKKNNLVVAHTVFNDDKFHAWSHPGHTVWLLPDEVLAWMPLHVPQNVIELMDSWSHLFPLLPPQT